MNLIAISLISSHKYLLISAGSHQVSLRRYALSRGYVAWMIAKFTLEELGEIVGGFHTWGIPNS